MIQVVKHFREHFVAVLVDDGREKDLVLVGVASYRHRWDVVSTAGRVCRVVESEEF